MAWTPDQQAEFRRRVAQMEFEMDDDLQEFYYRNPRIMEAFGRGKLRAMLEQEYFPMNPPPRAARTMDEASLWPLFFNRRACEQLIDFELEVDYRPPRREALLRAKIVGYEEADWLLFDDERIKREALKRTNGIARVWVRKLLLRDQVSFNMIDLLVQLYGFTPADARTVAALIERYPAQLDDGRELAATLPCRPSAAATNLGGGYLQYLMKLRSSVVGSDRLEFAFLVVCPAPKL